jgi:acetyl esterase/lipase
MTIIRLIGAARSALPSEITCCISLRCRPARFREDGHDASDPFASPLHVDLTGLPPIRVHVGDDEVLLDDSVRIVERAVAAGVDARVDVWEGMVHGFLGGVGRLDRRIPGRTLCFAKSAIQR